MTVGFDLALRAGAVIFAATAITGALVLPRQVSTSEQARGDPAAKTPPKKSTGRVPGS